MRNSPTNWELETIQNKLWWKITTLTNTTWCSYDQTPYQFETEGRCCNIDWQSWRVQGLKTRYCELNQCLEQKRDNLALELYQKEGASWCNLTDDVTTCPIMNHYVS